MHLDKTGLPEPNKCVILLVWKNENRDMDPLKRENSLWVPAQDMLEGGFGAQKKGESDDQGIRES